MCFVSGRHVILYSCWEIVIFYIFVFSLRRKIGVMTKLLGLLMTRNLALLAVKISEIWCFRLGSNLRFQVDLISLTSTARRARFLAIRRPSYVVIALVFPTIRDSTRAWQLLEPIIIFKLPPYLKHVLLPAFISIVESSWPMPLLHENVIIPYDVPLSLLPLKNIQAEFYR